MEDKSPTMPYMLLRNFRVHQTVPTSQGQTSYCEYFAAGEVLCPRCSSNEVVFYDHYKRRAMFLLRGYEKRYFVIKAKRYRCPHCGRVFREPIEGLKAWQRSSIDLRKHMAARYRQGVCNKNIAKEFKVSESTVERIIHERYEAKVKELLHYSAPLVIGIDEHKIHKRRFATTIVDLKNHRVYDIIEGKSETSIGARIRSYPGRMQVKVVCMDLSSPYRSLVQRCFPNAKIVADRFHVIKLVLSTFMEFCREMQPEIRWKRHITGSLRTHNANLTSVQRATLKTFLAANPIIESAYNFKEKLCKLLNNKKKTKIQCVPLIKELQKCMDQMRTEATRHFHTLADTLSKWFEPIIRMWRFSKNNGITEGFHRKIKGIQRRGYGYRNFQNYKLRVLVECSHGR